MTWSVPDRNLEIEVTGQAYRGNWNLLFVELLNWNLVVLAFASGKSKASTMEEDYGRI